MIYLNLYNAIEVHPLEIGGKDAPARLVFSGISGDGISVCMTIWAIGFALYAQKLN